MISQFFFQGHCIFNKTSIMCARTRHSFCGIRKRNKNARNFPLDPRNFPFDPRNFQFDPQNFQNFRKFHFSPPNERNRKK